MSVAWITPALADLNDYLAAAQVTGVNTSALADDQADRFTRISSNTVLRMRNAIETGGYVLSATAGTIPPELHDVWAYLVIAQLQPAVSLPLTDDLARQIDRAESRIGQVANGELQVSEPSDPASTATVQGATTPSMTAKTLVLTRDEQDGL